MRKLLAVSLISILSFAFSAVAQVTPEQFSADLLMHSQRGDINGKMFFGDKKVRTDMETPQGSMSNITDTAAKKVYMVMHEQKMYMEVDLSRPAPMMGRGPRTPEVREFDPANPCSARSDRTCKKVGAEKVNGRDCDKWEWSKAGQLKETNWIDKKLHIAIKTVHDDGSTWELRNLKEGHQPESLFEVPPAYQKFDMGNMMRGPNRQD